MLEFLRRQPQSGLYSQSVFVCNHIIQLVKNHLPRAAKVINRYPPRSTGFVPFEPSIVQFTQRKGTVPFLAGLKLSPGMQDYEIVTELNTLQSPMAAIVIRI